jgi:hypothetical protein
MKRKRSLANTLTPRRAAVFSGQLSGKTYLTLLLCRRLAIKDISTRKAPAFLWGGKIVTLSSLGLNYATI